MTERQTRCANCGEVAVLRTGTTRYRRGTRVLPVETAYWECTASCDAETGEVPFTFEDAELMRANDAAARAAWLEKYGEPMPKAKRPGRRSDVPRPRRVPVMMSDEELALLDRLRGGLSRGAFIRKVLQEAKGEPPKRVGG